VAHLPSAARTGDGTLRRAAGSSAPSSFRHRAKNGVLAKVPDHRLAGSSFGHGTGSIRHEFDLLADEHTGMAGLSSANPHNQILATAIQLGLVGALLLLAVWIAHLLFFFAPGLPAGIAFAIVVQNVISSQFNSSLFDFTHGWVYVLGTGVLGGMVVRDSLHHSRKSLKDLRRSTEPNVG
jgi:hypothetical protein